MHLLVLSLSADLSAKTSRKSYLLSTDPEWSRADWPVQGTLDPSWQQIFNPCFMLLHSCRPCRTNWCGFFFVPGNSEGHLSQQFTQRGCKRKNSCRYKLKNTEKSLWICRFTHMRSCSFVSALPTQNTRLYLPLPLICILPNTLIASH